MSPDAPPTAPNPQNTIQQQQQANQSTAQTNFGMNVPNQITPYGSIQTTTGADGKPQYSWSFSPQEQAIYNSFAANRLGAGEATSSALGNVQSTLSQPFNLDNPAVEGRINDLARLRLDPIIQQQEEATRTRLMNAGAQPGTEAWDRGMTQFGQDRNDAYNQLLLSGRGQSINELLMQRNQPIQELGALFGYGQPQNPSWINQPQYNQAGVDTAGITQQGYENSLLPWQTEEANRQAMMAGIFGMAGRGVQAGTMAATGGMGGWGKKP